MVAYSIVATVGWVSDGTSETKVAKVVPAHKQTAREPWNCEYTREGSAKYHRGGYTVPGPISWRITADTIDRWHIVCYAATEGSNPAVLVARAFDGTLGEVIHFRVDHFG